MFHEMFVELRTLKPNPRRDFTVNPVSMISVDQTVILMQQGKFWDGIICHKTANGIEIAVGHSRIRAALKVGFTEAHITVLDDGKNKHKQVRTRGFPWCPR